MPPAKTCENDAHPFLRAAWSSIETLQRPEQKSISEVSNASGPIKGEKQRMPVTTILIIILILALIGVFPSWPHARAWGYGPSGLLGIVLVILLILLLLGRI